MPHCKALIVKSIFLIHSFKTSKCFFSPQCDEHDMANILLFSLNKLATKEAAMAKSFSSQTAMDSATDCVQIFGGYGYMQEYGVERLMRDAKITQIYEGTTEIQNMVIARELLEN